jgi:hypothetical protein
VIERFEETLQRQREFSLLEIDVTHHVPGVIQILGVQLLDRARCRIKELF